MILLTSQTVVILLSIGVFLFVIMALVLLLLYARKKLTPQGEVKLTINDEKELIVDPGNTLLATMSNNDIYLPSACGGGGTCGMCKAQILEGGGDILPTETGFFTRKEQKENWRLGCQVKVRDDMKIQVPEEILGIKKFSGTVVSNKNVSTFIKELVIEVPESEDIDFKPGGYIQLDVPQYDISFQDFDIPEEYRDDWDHFNLWDIRHKNTEEVFRAYSMANYPAEGQKIMLNIRIATPPWDKNKNAFMKVPPGICSTYTFSLKKGDEVTLSGPYGDFLIKDTDREMVYIGGGAGMAPLRSHIFHLFNTLETDRKVSFWYGARSKKEIFYEKEFRELEEKFPNFTFTIALSEPKDDDEWKGDTGFIHQILLDKYLSKLEEPEEIEYYLCGPPMMNDATLSMLDNLGVPKEMIAFDDFGI